MLCNECGAQVQRESERVRERETSISVRLDYYVSYTRILGLFDFVEMSIINLEIIIRFSESPNIRVDYFFSLHSIVVVQKMY